MTPIAPPARIAFIGLGTMGAAMAANIARAGFALAVNTRTRATAAALEASGATWAATPAEAARGAALLALCVPDTPDVEAVLLGAGGVIDGASPGTIAIDFSTIAPDATRRFAASLAERGVTLLDSPVSGGPKGAIDGTLTCMVGGDEPAFAASAAVFAAVGRTITRLGPSGSGQICKAANQMIIAATMQAVAEALSMGTAAGLDARAMREALLGGSAASAVLTTHTMRMLDQAFQPAGFRAALMLKDLRIALAAARDAGAYAPAAGLALAAMQAVVNSGRGADDNATIGQWIAEQSGLAGLGRPRG